MKAPLGVLVTLVLFFRILFIQFIKIKYSKITYKLFIFTKNELLNFQRLTKCLHVSIKTYSPYVRIVLEQVKISQSSFAYHFIKEL